MRSTAVRWPTPRAGLALLLFFALDCQPPQSSWAACRHIAAPDVVECSGVEFTRRHPDVLWVHNDSGDAARFFAIDRNGELRAEIAVDGADNVDWEDIAADDMGHLYLGDFGNNRNERRDLRVYVVAEPDVTPVEGRKLRIPVLRTLRFRYADQTAYPDPAHLNFDCEAMYWHEGALWLLTKHRSDIATTLYRLDPTIQDEQVLEPVATADIGSPVTAADCSPDGRFLVVLSYQYIHVFERPRDGGVHLRGNVHATLIEGRQCEGLCFDGNRVLFTNEQRDVHCLELEDLRSRQQYMPRVPHVEIPRLEAARLDGSASEWRGKAGRLVLTTDTARSPAAADSVVTEVRLGWDGEGLALHARFAPPQRSGRPVLFLMVGPDTGDRPCLLPDQMVWAATWSGDTLALAVTSPESGQPRCGEAAKAAPARSRTLRGTDALEFEARVALAGLPRFGPGTRLRVNVVVVGAGGNAESAWAGALDTQPLGNPLLWGHAVLGAAPRGARP